MFYNLIDPLVVAHAKNFIRSNLRDGSLTVRSKSTGEEYIIAERYKAYDGWAVFKGCDLVIGDTTFDHAVLVLLIETSEDKWRR